MVHPQGGGKNAGSSDGPRARAVPPANTAVRWGTVTSIASAVSLPIGVAPGQVLAEPGAAGPAL